MLIFVIAAAAAAQLSPPRGTDIRTVFSDDDVPYQYLPEESDRSVGIRLTVRPDGKVQRCEAEYTSGIEGLVAAREDGLVRARPDERGGSLAAHGRDLLAVVVDDERALGPDGTLLVPTFSASLHASICAPSSVTGAALVRISRVQRALR